MVNLAASGSLAEPSVESIQSDTDLRHPVAQRSAVAFSDVRFRFEDVEAGGRGNASAFTARIRAGVEADIWEDFAFLLEIEGLADPTGVEADTARSRLIPDRPVVQVNRAQFTKAFSRGQIIAGRQRLDLSDERLVGTSSFRQNEQTYDALRVVSASLRGITIDMTYLWQVNRFGDSRAVSSQFVGDTILVHVNAPTPIGQLTAFHYAMDLSADDGPFADNTASNQTSGLGLLGRWRRDDIQIEWRADYAHQSDHADNPMDYKADYSRLRLKLETDQLAIAIVRESLGSEGVQAFQTPLGSNHGFLGSAEMFVVAPPTGVIDQSLEGTIRVPAIGSFRNITAVGRHHRFESASGTAKLGSEWDLIISAVISGYRLSFEHARYSAKSFRDDTTRSWLTIARSF